MTNLSIIIPVFNRQIEGERALRSVLSQNVSNTEIIVVDDGSEPHFKLPDDIEGDNVRIIRHPFNNGAASARNTGILAAQGDWLAFLDSDDYWLPETLTARFAMATELHATNSSALVAYVAGFILHDQRSGRQEMRIPRTRATPLHFASGCWFSPGSTLLVPKIIYQKIGIYDTALPRMEDLDWFLRFALDGGRLERWPHAAAMIEIRGKPSMSSLDNSARHLIAKYGDRGSPHYLGLNYIRRFKAYFDLVRASKHADNRNWILTFFYLARSFMHVPRTTLHIERFWE